MTGRDEFRLELIPGGTEETDAAFGEADGRRATGAVASSE